MGDAASTFADHARRRQARPLANVGLTVIPSADIHLCFLSSQASFSSPLSNVNIDGLGFVTNAGTNQRAVLFMAGGPAMVTILDRFLKGMPSPLLFIVAGYIGLR